MLEVIAGDDQIDSTVSKKPVSKYSDELDFDKKVKIGYFKEIVESEDDHTRK